MEYTPWGTLTIVGDFNLVALTKWPTEEGDCQMPGQEEQRFQSAKSN